MNDKIEKVTPEMFSRIYRQHGQQLRTWACLRWGLKEDEVEDVMQDIWLTAYSKRDKLDPNSKIWPWLRAILRFKALSHHRKRGQIQRRQSALEAYSETAQRPDPHQLHDSERWIAVAQILAHVQDELSSRHRVALSSHVYGNKGKEIAQELGVAYSTSQRKIREAKDEIGTEFFRRDRPRAWFVALLQPKRAITRAGRLMGSLSLEFALVPTALALTAVLLAKLASVSPPMALAPKLHSQVAQPAPELVTWPNPIPPTHRELRSPPSEAAREAPKPAKARTLRRIDVPREVTRARKAYLAGSFHEAIAILDEIPRTETRMLELRTATYVAASCALGDAEAAKHEFNRLERRNPESKMIVRINRTCW